MRSARVNCFPSRYLSCGLRASPHAAVYIAISGHMAKRQQNLRAGDSPAFDTRRQSATF
jgi:hypothetical protein